MSITDDGVGMPKGGVKNPGLGTSIVLALANQLKAEVRVVSMTPGTAVLVEHKDVAEQGHEVAVPSAV
jgi:two-component sensor histidine kinase